MDAESLGFSDSSFDTVWSWGVIHHSADTPRVLSEIYRVLRKGGQARIMVYHRGLLYYMLGLSGVWTYGWQRAVQRRTDGALARFYSVGEWKTLASQTGFRIGRIRILGAKQEAIPLPRRFFRLKVSRVFPDGVARGLLTSARLGSFMVSELEKA